MAAKKKSTKAAAKKAAAKAKPKPKVRRPTVLRRLEKGEGDTRTFWELSRLDLTLTTRFGRHLSAGRSVTKTFETKTALETAIDKLLADKRAEGYSDPAPKEVIGGSSRKGVTARNPELEALIEEDPSDLSRYLIYADWLQQEMDPRGELIMAQHALATSTSDHELDAAEHIEEQLLKTFQAELVGDLAKYTRFRGAFGSSSRGISWRCGFIRAIRIQQWGARLPTDDAIRALLDHPSGRFIEHIGVDASALADACEALSEPGKTPKTFTTLAISNPYYFEESLAPLAKLDPPLRKLWLSGGFEGAGLDAVRGLEELDVAVASPETLRAITSATWPDLRRLHLSLSTVEPTDVSASLPAILQRLPVIEHLTLRRWLVGADGALQPQDRIAYVILETFRQEKTPLVRLDLEMALTKAGAEGLAPIIRELPRTLRLHIPKAAISDAVTRAMFASELKVVLVDGDVEERDRNNIDAYHHAKPG